MFHPSLINANGRLNPVALCIPVGMRLHRKAVKAYQVETSLIDWVYTMVQECNPAIDRTTCAGSSVFSKVTKSISILVAVHQRRDVMRVGAHRCSSMMKYVRPWSEGIFRSLDGGYPDP
ncbi:hypothetical protein [Pajaroellobacter abortibovis]|uniref:Uncharacterized protein n=1 Tax=Pajaroellobacter abortibovis TaxID=1882918 RepID=A0A1L6MXR3_9BACT|nr:hypothetical protein [Pajaroellobacter abortibovis]APS00235.1 hypothetical protein BCY86_05720 [Pajaroellobacter abortibovis]